MTAVVKTIHPVNLTMAASLLARNTQNCVGIKLHKSMTYVCPVACSVGEFHSGARDYRLANRSNYSVFQKGNNFNTRNTAFPSLQNGTPRMRNATRNVSSSPSSLSSISDRLDEAKAFRPPAMDFSYTERDLILYAFGIGVSTQQSDYLKFLFELSQDFCAVPSFGVIPAFKTMETAVAGGLPGFEVDPTRVLHGEQYLELYKPIPRKGKLTSRLTVPDIIDKKSGFLALYNVETFDENNEKVSFNQFNIFVVGGKGEGLPKSSSELKPLENPPKRAPDAEMTEKTHVDQAALYRLSGDYNPLHIEPSFAAMGGFPTPILHGLCSFGHAVRHVMKTFADNDMSRFKAVKVRFAKPVLPGQSLKTEMWKEGNRVNFQTKVVENGNACITGAYLDLLE